MSKGAIVTGGTRGLGRAIVEELAEAGYFVHFTFLSSEAAAAEIVERLGADKVRGARCDGTRLQDVKEFVDQTFAHEGSEVEVLVNNAGITRDKALMLMDPEDWQAVIDTNLTGVFNFCRAAALHFFRMRRGSIVNMSSVAGIHGNAGQVNYAASKAGIIGLTKALSRELSPRGVRVNAVAPGLIESDMTGQLDQKKRSELEARILLGRFGQGREVAKVVRFLAGEDASYITGQVLQLDGGLSL